MKAKTRKAHKAAKARKAASTPMPAGLITMMALIREDFEGGNAPESNARRAYPLALHVIKRLRDNYGHVDLTGAADKMYPGLDSEPTGDTCASAGFYVGVATAWLLLREIGGGHQ